MTPFEKAILWGSTALVSVSGIVFLVLKYFVVSDDPFAVVNHPWQPFFLKMHVLTAPLLVFAVGVVFLRHIWRQFRSGLAAGRRTGILVFVILVPMVVSGYLIQTATSRPVLSLLAMVHIVAGIGYVVSIAGHQLRAWAHERTVRRRRAARPEADPAC